MRYRIIQEGSLAHYGILGMKWGVRRYQNADGSLTAAGKKRYSDEQRHRDEKIYGKKAARRIEEKVNRGESIQGARHDEVVRRNRHETAKDIGRIAAKAAISVAGAAAAYKIMERYGSGNMNSTVASASVDAAMRILRRMI